MLVSQDEPMIQTLATDGARPAFRDCISLGCCHWCTDLTDTKRSDSAIERGAKAAITVVNQLTRWFPRYSEGFDHLLRQPRRIGMSRDPRMYEFTTTVVNDEEYVQCLKPDILNRK